MRAPFILTIPRRQAHLGLVRLSAGKETPPADEAGGGATRKSDALVGLPLVAQRFLARKGYPVTASLLEAALQYAARGWRVIPVYGFTAGKCDCGRACGDSAGKHPRIKKNEDGTWGWTDAAAIERHWRRHPTSNIGLATGRGLIVVDLDNAAQRALLATLWAARNSGVPDTLAATTGRGAHLYFAGELDGSRYVEDLLIRGDNSYVIAPPSNHRSGRTYQWLNQLPLSEFPEWLKDTIETFEKEDVTNNELASLLNSKPPAFLQLLPKAERHKSLTAKALALDIPQQSPELMAEIESALAAVPASCNRQTWYEIGMALKSLGWERSDGTSVVYDLWRDWSAGCAEKFSDWSCETVWKSIKDPLTRAGRTIGLGRLFFHAKAHGWRQPLAEPVRQNAASPRMNGHAAPAALLAPVSPKSIVFIDLDEKKKPRATCTNAGLAINGLHVSCRKDVFHEKMLVGGHLIQSWAGDLSDDVVHMLRKVIKRTYLFDPGERNTRDAAVQLCLEHQFNPVVDYLDGLAWDGVPRLAGWLTTYLSAPASRLTAAIGRLMLIAAVRRARCPGTKFDQIVVLEGREGTGKSTALKILAGEENFSDQHLIGASDKEQQEAVTGVWVHEIAELAGMRRTDVERVKAFASRTEDRARPAYGRVRVDMKRRGIFVATTNADTYLMSETGNRRFWPVRTGRIDLESLARDRDQLWAEAAHAEAKGESLALPVGLWLDMAEMQAERLEDDAWESAIRAYAASKDWDVSINETLFSGVLLSLGEMKQGEQNRAARILKKLGMSRYRKNEGGKREWRYKLLGPLGHTGA